MAQLPLAPLPFRHENRNDNDSFRINSITIIMLSTIVLEDAAPFDAEQFVQYSRALHAYTLQMWAESRRKADEQRRVNALRDEMDAKLRRAQRSRSSGNRSNISTQSSPATTPLRS